MAETVEYTFEEKERLVRRIEKLKKQKYLDDIEDIIVKNNPGIEVTANVSGKYMYFSDLTPQTYRLIDTYIKKILKNKAESTIAPELTSDVVKYSEDDPFNNANSKAKYSNREKNLIKRKMYEKQINNKGDSPTEPLNESASEPQPVTNVFGKKSFFDNF